MALLQSSSLVVGCKRESSSIRGKEQGGLLRSGWKVSKSRFCGLEGGGLLVSS